MGEKEEAEKYFKKKIEERLSPDDSNRKVEGGPSELVKRIIKDKDKDKDKDKEKT